MPRHYVHVITLLSFLKLVFTTYHILMIYFVVHRLDPPCGICTLSKIFIITIIITIIIIIALDSGIVCKHE